MFFLKRKKAFTLAEIMIVLTIIGVITGILLPIAHNSLPNEKVMKFKKGHATLYKVINELVTSDKYYLDGDLGTRADGRLIDGSHEGDVEYLCKTISEVVSTKSENCLQNGSDNTCGFAIQNTRKNYSIVLDRNTPDLACKCAESHHHAEIITSDKISYFQSNSLKIFGSPWVKSASSPEYENCVFAQGGVTECFKARFFSQPGGHIVHPDENGFDAAYKIICMDIDGYTLDKECDDTNDVCPFGYGVRADGAIIVGNRALEWLEKDIQDKD